MKTLKRNNVKWGDVADDINENFTKINSIKISNTVIDTETDETFTISFGLQNGQLILNYEKII